MLNYIALYPNEHEAEFNTNFLDAAYDKPMDYYVICCMEDLTTVANIELEGYDIIEDQDEIDINKHMVNINFKKKDLNSIVFPKYSYMMDSWYHEIEFHYRVHTNLNEKRFTKRILVPTEVDGRMMLNGKRTKAIWQLVDASTYSRRGQITMKSSMPIMIYCNKHKIIPDVEGTEFVLPIYSYAQDSTRKKRAGVAAAKKKQVKFINPLFLYLTKMGCKKTIKFFGMDGIVEIKNNYKEKDKEDHYIFECNEVYIHVRKDIFDKEEMCQAFVCMFYHLQNRDFPVTKENLEDKEYWMCRIGYIGSVKNKNILSFLEKGKTSIHMIERLYNRFSKDSLRLPEIYKSNIYYIIYWMIMNFDDMKQRVNIDMANKRIRKNEAIVDSTLGRKINENINKLIERKTKSKMNNMDTLLELFNFNSDIIISGMKNMNDIVKSDNASNDMAFMDEFSYTAKGYQSLGEGNSKNISDKYRYLHPSMVGVLDLFTTSNSDCGMSGSIVPFVKLYDEFFFTPNKEPCNGRYKFEKSLYDNFGIDRKLPLDSFEEYIQYVSDHNQFKKDLEYEKIEIVEREV